MEMWPIGVFASVDAGLGVRWEVIQELNVPTIHLHAPQRSSRTKERAREFRKQLTEQDIQVTAVFAGFEGESYADIPTVQRTVGLVPQETRADRLQEMKEIADFAAQLQCGVVGLHLGFVPEKAEDAGYDEIVKVTRELCDHCGGAGQRVHLETGQETAEGLLRFLAAVDRQNLRVNFDPANMILYGTGEPIPALRKIGDHIGSVHCKDATWSDKPGETWGAEVPLGEGDVDIRKYLETLLEIGYRGPLTIEREIPQDPERQKQEIGAAVRLLTELRGELTS